MKGLTSVVTVLAIAACGSDDSAVDASSDAAAVSHDLSATGHCAHCDDLLVLRITLVSGSPFVEIRSTISIR